MKEPPAPAADYVPYTPAATANLMEAASGPAPGPSAAASGGGDNAFNKRTSSSASMGPQLHEEDDYVSRYFTEAPYRAKVNKHLAQVSLIPFFCPLLSRFDAFLNALWTHFGTHLGRIAGLILDVSSDSDSARTWRRR